MREIKSTAAGNAISVDLTTKVTASSQITVLFDADAPTTQDLTGVDFLSTVDDSGTGDAAQSTTEGNGDGNAGDLNSWTVTTTDGGGICLVIDGTASTASTVANTVTFSHTTAGTDRLMLVAVSMTKETGGVPSVLATSNYNGSTLTLVGSQATSDNKGRLEIWRLLAPASGSNNLTINLSSAPDAAVVGVMTFTGVDQTTPLGAFSSATVDSGTASVNVASAVDELVFAAMVVEGGGDKALAWVGGGTVGPTSRSRWR